MLRNRMEGSTNFIRTKDPEYWRHAILYISHQPEREREREALSNVLYFLFFGFCSLVLIL